ncbi:helix-turn-helix domain-containing protein [Anaerotignum propionicum]|uniref:helix-turn-helix domain-containing protein n=1 Tax=Anaerotignum propionicum TaxID=28446 RepID=UPI002108CBD6|nr:helix-turn-helix transcriptional regulator [Anaerotignum propionicum]MCQ4934997.1 helix-turn-helix domain-containing protein [Anaerotignum propionicum]
MYENFKKLLDKRGITIYKFCKDTGISESTIYTWKKKQSQISGELGKKICDYFEVSFDYLMTGKEPEPTVTVVDEENNIIVLDDDTLELIDSLRSKPEMKMLFSVSKNATPEDIIKTIKIIEALRDKE